MKQSNRTNNTKEYELTLEDYLYLSELHNSKYDLYPDRVNYLMLGWIDLGNKYKFNPYTVKPIGKSYYRFTAESTE